MSERFELKGRTLRQHTARGTLVNTAFLIGISLITLIKGFALAAFLSREDYGLYGILAVSLGTLLWLKQVGIGDKFIQQDEPDQEAAFQKAFTLEALSNGIALLVLAAVLPLVAVVYGEPDLLGPGYVVLLVVLAAPLQTPLWIHYRRMAFVRQRLLQAIDPVVSLLVALALAIAGAGVWALVIGQVTGILAGAAAATATSPYPLRWRYDRDAVRSYFSFSWPLFVAGLAGTVIAQSAMLVTEAKLGLAAAGALALASTVSQFSDRADAIVTGTLYPAVVSVKDRTETLLESFVKSNRFALMWAVPFGAGLTLFAPDLVAYGIGDEWKPAVILLQAFGITAAVGHIGFNWHVYFRAIGDTRPIALANAVAAIVFVAALIPLTEAYALKGLALAVGAQVAAHVGLRAYYLRRLFAGFSFLGHALRAVLPTVPALAAVLALRGLLGERDAAQAVVEFVVYVVVTAIATYRFEGDLLREAVRYVTGRASSSAAASAPSRTA